MSSLALLRKLDYPFCVLDTSGAMLFMSTALKHLLSIHTTVTHLQQIDPFFQPSLSPLLPSLLKGGAPLSINLIHKAEQPYRCSVSTIDWENSTASLLTFQFDQQAMQQKVDKYEQIIDNSMDAIVGIDEKGLITIWNKKAASTFGWEKEEVSGQSLSSSIIPTQHRKAHDAGMERYHQTGHGPIINQRIEITAMHKSGREFPIEVTVSPGQTSEDTAFFTAFMRDISQKKASQRKLLALLDQLEASNKNLEDFAYIVSHDLKAPLRGIKSLAEWLSTDHKEVLNAEGQRLLRLLTARAQLLDELIDGILAYSRVGKPESARSWYSMSTLLEESIELLEARKKATITIPDDLPTLRCDRTRILQIFQNLLSNALKFNDKEKPEILIEAKRLPGSFRLSFSDNGIGIEESDRDRIFKMFQRADKKTEGTGIGLAIVKKIIENYQGSVSVRSTPGKGSTFIITFPVDIIK